MPRFQIELDDATAEGLALCALEDLRDLPKQAAWMLRQAVRARVAQAEAIRRLEGNSLESAQEVSP